MIIGLLLEWSGVGLELFVNETDAVGVVDALDCGEETVVSDVESGLEQVGHVVLLLEYPLEKVFYHSRHQSHIMYTPPPLDGVSLPTSSLSVCKDTCIVSFHYLVHQWSANPFKHLFLLYFLL